MIFLYALADFYLLWVLYLAVMNLKRAKMNGTLNLQTKILGYPLVWFAYFIDFTCNIIISFVLLDPPKETTVTEHLKRIKATETGWRLSIAKWFETILNQFDPEGNHI